MVDTELILKFLVDMASTISIPRSCLRGHRSSLYLGFHLSALQNCVSPVIKRHASGSNKSDSRSKDQNKKKRKARATFLQYDLKAAEQFSLCDAMRCETRLQNTFRIY